VLYVPIVVPPTPPSPRTRELANLLSTVIQEYEKHHPAVTGGEIHQALDLAKQGSQKAMATNRVLVVTVAGGLLALAGVGAFMATAAGGGGQVGFPVLAVVVGILLVVGLAVALKRMGNL